MSKLTTEWLTKRLSELRSGDAGQRYLCALSGGLDSSVLLHAVAAIPGVELRAMHIDHGLHPDAASWSEHAARACRRLGLSCLLVQVEVAARRNIEAAARQARYQALAEALEPGETLLTAHHQDDQLETVLLQLLRGAGPAGLAAMPERARFAAGWHLRPLLSLRREDLADFARRHGVDYVEDASNKAQRYDRNYLRHEVVPIVAERWPSAATSVARSAALAANTSRLLADLAGIDSHGGIAEPTLTLDVLKDLPARRYANVVREWLRAQGVPVPNHARLVEFVRQLRSAGVDRLPCLDYGDVVLRAFRSRLFLSGRTDKPPADWAATLGVNETVRLPGELGTLTLTPVARGGLADAIVEEGLRVAFRAGGEKLRAAPGGSTVTVKNLLSQHGVLPWMRDCVPMLWAGGRLAAVADLWLSQDLLARPGRAGYAVLWNDRPELFEPQPPSASGADLRDSTRG